MTRATQKEMERRILNGLMHELELAPALIDEGERPDFVVVLPERAGSDEAAQAFRDDGAWYSDMMPPRTRSLAGW